MFEESSKTSYNNSKITANSIITFSQFQPGRQSGVRFKQPFSIQN